MVNDLSDVVEDEQDEGKALCDDKNQICVEVALGIEIHDVTVSW